MRSKITKLFEEIGQDYLERKIADYEIHQGHDVHVFYILQRNVEKVVHVQGYPGMSTYEELQVFSRMMDLNIMKEIRNTGRVSIGNEHEAVVKCFPNFGIGVRIPYNREVLEKKIGENVPELNPAYYQRFKETEIKEENEILNDKYSLRDYLKAFDLSDTNLLRKKSEEILINVRNVMKPYIEGKRGKPLRDYYTPAVNMIEKAYKNNNFNWEFSIALEFMIDSVKWE